MKPESSKSFQTFVAAAMLALPGFASAAVLNSSLTSSSGSFNEGDTVELSVGISPDSGEIAWNIALGGSAASGTTSPATHSVVFDQDDASLSWSITGTTYDNGNLEDFNDGGSFSINNVAPTIVTATIGGVDDQIGSVIAFEGDYLFADMRASDPGADGHTFNINVNGGPNITRSDATTTGERYSGEVDITQMQNGNYTINYEATDDDVSTYTSRSLNVFNVKPMILIAGLNGVDSDISVSEGDSITARMSSTDPGADYQRFSISIDGGMDLGAGQDDALSGNRVSNDVDVTQMQDGTYVVRFEVYDGDESSEVFRTINVFNVPPTITNAPLDQIIDFNNGYEFIYSASATDPGVLDTLTFGWDFNGDGIYTDATGSDGLFDLGTLGLTVDTTLTLGVAVYDGSDYAYHSFNAQFINVVPEPVSLGMLGFAGLVLRRRQ